jgi:hypothetical protein
LHPSHVKRQRKTSAAAGTNLRWKFMRELLLGV